MKRFHYLLAGILLLSACHGAQPGNTTTSSTVADSTHGFPILTFEKQEHDFGTVHEGEVVEYSFKFKNTGTAPLLIESASASCGCTIPEVPKEPIKPGEDGYMKVSFNSTGKIGAQLKEISIKANTNPPFLVGPKIICNVVKVYDQSATHKAFI